MNICTSFSLSLYIYILVYLYIFIYHSLRLRTCAFPKKFRFIVVRKDFETPIAPEPRCGETYVASTVQGAVTTERYCGGRNP